MSSSQSHIPNKNLYKLDSPSHVRCSQDIRCQQHTAPLWYFCWKCKIVVRLCSVCDFRQIICMRRIYIAMPAVRNE
jgi:hypothetical protein